MLGSYSKQLETIDELCYYGTLYPSATYGFLEVPNQELVKFSLIGEHIVCELLYSA